MHRHTGVTAVSYTHLRGEPTEEELRERLRGARVDLYIRRNENGRIVVNELRRMRGLAYAV